MPIPDIRGRNAAVRLHGTSIEGILLATRTARRRAESAAVAAARVALRARAGSLGVSNILNV
jgi:hypothetical protein